MLALKKALVLDPIEGEMLALTKALLLDQMLV